MLGSRSTGGAHPTAAQGGDAAPPGRGSRRSAARRRGPRRAGRRRRRARRPRPARAARRRGARSPAPGRRRRGRRAAARRAGAAPGGSPRSACSGGRVARLRERGVDDRVEHGGLVAQQRERAQHVGLGRRVERAQRRQQLARRRLRANAGESLLASSRQVSPRASQWAAGLLARDAEQRAHEPALARGHPEQRAPAGRRGEPVEHGLDLVGRRVAGGDVAACDRATAARVALVACPRLKVPVLPGEAGRCRRTPRAAYVQLDAEPLAQLGAERGVLAGLRA